MHGLLPFTHKTLLLCAPDDPPAGGNNPPADPPDGEGEKKTFTQKELDALFAQRGKQGASQREKELLEALGVTTLDEAKSRLAAAKTLEDNQKSELQKAQDLAAAEKARADKAEADRQAAEARALETALRSALSAEALKQGIDEGELTSVWREFRDSEALRGKVEANEAGDEFAGLEAVVKEVVKAHPRWLAQRGDGDGLRRKQDINATNRGRTGEPSPDELVQRKRSNATYSGI